MFFFCRDISHIVQKKRSLFQFAFVQYSPTASSAARGPSILFGHFLMSSAAVLRSFQLFSDFGWLTETNRPSIALVHSHQTEWRETHA